MRMRVEGVLLLLRARTYVARWEGATLMGLSKGMQHERRCMQGRRSWGAPWRSSAATAARCHPGAWDAQRTAQSPATPRPWGPRGQKARRQSDKLTAERQVDIRATD